MQIPVLIEPIAPNVYRARTGEPLALTTQGTTADEAMEQMRAQIAARLSSGSKFVTLQVPDSSNPWLRIAGMFKDDPEFDDWLDAMAEYRREVEADPNYR